MEPGALFVGNVCAKHTFPLSVSTVKLSQFLYFPVDLGLFALTSKHKNQKQITIKIFL